MKCAICKDRIFEEYPNFVRGLNPLTFRNAGMHFWCFKDAYDELAGRPPKDAGFESRQEEYNQRIA